MANQETFMADVDPYLDSLYSTALRLTKKPADAQDLVQEALMKAYKAYANFEAGTNLKAWLFRILTNSYINIYRYKKRRPREVDVDDADTMFLYHKLRGSTAADITQSPEEDFLKTITDTDISEALAELPDQYRQVVLLADVEGLSYAEIAEILEIPPGTVMSRLHRGRKALQKALWDYAVEHNLVGPEQKRLAEAATQTGDAKT
ncbi:MAG TPA: sigma-70 family RNA polymerase sigma factor [Acidimicrobiia bacterium]|nr:sigma-70 family RNA polymerase sigma factor [Acidimicrobiia bacterium]